MAYDRKTLLKILQDKVAQQLYDAADESYEAGMDAIGEVEAFLEGHQMHLDEKYEDEEEGEEDDAPWE